ncbi:MAG: FlgD immunoglobulin-like domain containing protein, partial [Candidatus Eiseniibacteriota bacterium]
NAAVASGATQAAGQTTEALAAAAQSDAQPSAPLIPLAPRIYPSPVHEHSTLSFSTSVAGRLSVEILDLAGRRVRQLSSESQAPAGMHHFEFDGRDGDAQRLGAGVYFYRIIAAEGMRTNRFVIIR